MEPAKLTWHPGSILPFASLWHTLLRVAALNSLRPHDLPDADPARRPGGRSSFHSRASLLYNESNDKVESISTRALATWLNEPHEAFAWSHLGRVPRGLRFLILDGFRICPVCVAGGYHTALLSLRLLDACPIHRCPLVDRCWCGHTFDGRLDGKTLGHVGHCHCGRTAFFTRETCRRPTMTPGETAPMREVVAWLERLSRVGLPHVRHEGSQTKFNAQWLQHLLTWCEALGLGYPACFTAPTGLPRPRIVTTVCAAVEMRRPVPRRAPSFAAGTPSSRSSYWHDDPATLVYRAMLRHLRRHVSRGAETQALDILSSPDPLRIGSLLRSSRTAMVAFAEMVWCKRIEPEVMRRRWPYRPIAHGSVGFYVGHIQPPWIGYHDSPGAGVVGERRAWLEYHACGAFIVSLWREAQRLALAAARSGIADWRPNAGGDAFSWATTIEGGKLRFVCLERQTGFEWTLPLPNKPLRREMWLANEAERRQKVSAECAGPCLTWSARGGWEVRDALAPTDANVARHRLFGVSADRPKFWLFVNGDMFVARACALKLQVAAKTPKEAIEGLRLAIRQHQRSCPPVLAKHPVPLVQPQPIRDPPRREYEMNLDYIRHACDFWRGASVFYSAAQDYLERNQRPGAD